MERTVEINSHVVEIKFNEDVPTEHQELTEDQINFIGSAIKHDFVSGPFYTFGPTDRCGCRGRWTIRR
jgi:hypothetical protein